MKKKVISLIAVLLVAVSSYSCIVYAESIVEMSNIYRYSHINNKRATLVSNGSNGICVVSASVNSSSSSDKLIITVNYIKEGSGSVGTKSTTVYRSADFFSGSVSKTLTSSGTYHCNVTMKLYDGSTLLETVTEQTNSIPY